jgi:hypothetical protein
LERGGRDGGKRWRAWASAAPIRVFQREREREQMSVVEAEARAWCCGAERTGATGVHAVDGAGMRPPRGVAHLRAIGRGVARAREGRRAAWAAGAGRAEARRERGHARAGS